MIKLWQYRVASFFELLFSDRFKSPEGIVRQTQLRYSEPSEIEYYSHSKNWNFLPEEREVLEQINLRAGKTLVVGCGAGREFSLLTGHELFGVDDCVPLLEKAKTNFPQAHLAESLDSFTGIKFEAIFVSFHVYNHIQGRQNRLDFISALASLSEAESRIYIFVDTFDLREGKRFLFVSWMLKLLWSSSRVHWDKGDTLRKYNGDHNPYGDLFFYHYFNNDEEIKCELLLSGLRVRKENNYWILSKS